MSSIDPTLRSGLARLGQFDARGALIRSTGRTRSRHAGPQVVREDSARHLQVNRGFAARRSRAVGSSLQTEAMDVWKLPNLLPAQVMELQDALLANADRLLTSALAVLDLGHVPLARSLAILGLEESGKAIAIHERRVEMASGPEGEPFRCDRLDELWGPATRKSWRGSTPSWWTSPTGSAWSPLTRWRTPATWAPSRRGHAATTG